MLVQIQPIPPIKFNLPRQLGEGAARSNLEGRWLNSSPGHQYYNITIGNIMKKTNLPKKILKNVTNTIKRTIVNAAVNAAVDGIVKTVTGDKAGKKKTKTPKKKTKTSK